MKSFIKKTIKQDSPKGRGKEGDHGARIEGRNKMERANWKKKKGKEKEKGGKVENKFGGRKGGGKEEGSKGKGGRKRSWNDEH
jgi:hypothetical protein